jgi:hypothetical protein
MKTIKLLLVSLIFAITTSCCNEETNVIQCNKVTETIIYDSQDNIVKLNGVWLQSMNLDVTPFQRINWIGFDQSIGNNSLRITSSKPIIQVLSPSFNYPYDVTFISPYEVVFHSNYMAQYYNNDDVYYFAITYKNE